MKNKQNDIPISMFWYEILKLWHNSLKKFWTKKKWEKEIGKEGSRKEGKKEKIRKNGKKKW